MRDKPVGIGERELRAALADGWRIDAGAVRYVPVGGGSYHWVVRDRAGARWFVTADDLDGKAWLGGTRAAVFDGLRAAMDTALALREDAGLGFVAAPIRSAGGAAVQPLGSRHAVSVFGFLDGTSGRFGQVLTAAERGRLAGLLAALHQATPAIAAVPRCAAGLPLRAVLETALGELSRPWTGGPFAEPARALLAGAQRQVRHLLQVFDELAVRTAAAAGELVITHGEPHPGNLIRAGRQLMLIDWDTVGLGPPERDLWMIAGEDGGALRRYALATGRVADTAALALYRLRWTLDDVSSFVTQLRSSHRRTPGAEHAWRSLNQAISHAAAASHRQPAVGRKRPGARGPAWPSPLPALPGREPHPGELFRRLPEAGG